MLIRRYLQVWSNFTHSWVMPVPERTEAPATVGICCHRVAVI